MRDKTRLYRARIYEYHRCRCRYIVAKWYYEEDASGRDKYYRIRAETRQLSVRCTRYLQWRIIQLYAEKYKIL